MQIDILNTEGTWKYGIKAVSSCEFTESLSGEYTLTFTVPSSKLSELSMGYFARYLGQYFKIVQIKKRMQSGIPMVTIYGEHVSYLLNDYEVETFDMTNTGSAILTSLLEGTSFTAGTVEIEGTFTMQINQKTTKRAALQQLVAILEGEISYNGYKISILTHRGSMIRKELLDTENVTDLQVSTDSYYNDRYDTSHTFLFFTANREIFPFRQKQFSRIRLRTSPF